jgi:hypothetical protein
MEHAGSWSSPEVLINFMQDHRAHMAFEVGLIICLLYFVLQKKYDPKRQDVPKVEEPTPEVYMILQRCVYGLAGVQANAGGMAAAAAHFQTQESRGLRSRQR